MKRANQSKLIGDLAVNILLYLKKVHIAYHMITLTNSWTLELSWPHVHLIDHVI